MRLAVMQPYIFPYLGYFQLVEAVDTFTFFDDVNFIKRGWIHRNQLLVSGQKHLFSVPLQQASQNKLIKDIPLHPSNYGQWRDKFLKAVYQSYRRAPFFQGVFTLLSGVLERPHETIATLAIDSVESVARFVGLKTSYDRSSSLDYDRSLTGQGKIIEICELLQATTYINPIGGTALYEAEKFSQRGLALRFIQSSVIRYAQGKNSFVPHLSIIDVLMYNEVSDVNHFLQQYTLIANPALHDRP